MAPLSDYACPFLSPFSFHFCGPCPWRKITLLHSGLAASLSSHLLQRDTSFVRGLDACQRPSTSLHGLLSSSFYLPPWPAVIALLPPSMACCHRPSTFLHGLLSSSFYLPPWAAPLIARWTNCHHPSIYLPPWSAPGWTLIARWTSCHRPSTSLHGLLSSSFYLPPWPAVIVLLPPSMACSVPGGHSSLAGPPATAA